MDQTTSNLKPDKGRHNGSCNRTACQKPGATWFNHCTYRYYCPECAELLNKVNRRESMSAFGHDTCTEGVPK